MLMQFRQNRLYFPDKDARVPDIMAIVEIALRRRQVRLLYEAFSRKRLVPMSLTDLIGEADVAVAGLGRGGLDADGDEASLFGQLVGQGERLTQTLDIRNNRIGAERRHHRLGIATRNGSRRPGDRSC